MKTSFPFPFSNLLLFQILVSSLSLWIANHNLVTPVQGLSLSPAPTPATKLSSLSFIGTGIGRQTKNTQTHYMDIQNIDMEHTSFESFESDINSTNMAKNKAKTTNFENAATHQPTQPIQAVTTALVSLLSSPTIVQALDIVQDNNMDDLEIAELPPVWVPIVFAIFILGGVGLLTSSLGDVYTEGTCVLCVLHFWYAHLLVVSCQFSVFSCSLFIYILYIHFLR